MRVSALFVGALISEFALGQLLTFVVLEGALSAVAEAVVLAKLIPLLVL